MLEKLVLETMDTHSAAARARARARRCYLQGRFVAAGEELCGQKWRFVASAPRVWVAGYELRDVSPEKAVRTSASGMRLRQEATRAGESSASARLRETMVLAAHKKKTLKVSRGAEQRGEAVLRCRCSGCGGQSLAGGGGDRRYGGL
jgi:hypothetical protein